MGRVFLWSAGVILAASTACASSSRSADEDPRPRRKVTHLPHSSIAAVLEHRAEIALTEDQVTKLEELDRKLEMDNLATERAAQDAADKEAEEKKAAKKPDAAAQDSSPGGMGMGGMNRGRGGMGTGGMGRRGAYGSAGRFGDAPQNPNSPEMIRARLDDNDTQAYLEAEKVLTEEQRGKARTVAEQYREDLWDRRQGGP